MREAKWSGTRRRQASLVLAAALVALLVVPGHSQSTKDRPPTNQNQKSSDPKWPTQMQVLKEHEPLHRKDRLEEASRLTEAVASGRHDGPVGRIPRKNFIDEFIFGKMEQDRIPHAALATDGEFFRRVNLDLTGRLPDPDQLKAFLSSSDPQKREKLVDSLLGSPEYLAKWTYWFGDLAMANANRIGNPGKNLFYRWVYDALHMNAPYDEFVQELLTAKGRSNYEIGPASYVARWVVIGNTCADTVHEDTSDDLAVNTAKHFLGLNLQCISCHDGKNHLEKMNVWLTGKKRRELWQQAAFFGKTRVLRRVERFTSRDEYSIDDKGQGYDAAGRSVVRIARNAKGFIEPAFILTGEKPEPGKPWREEFARMITSHPQFARATVNTFWAELMGVGIVDPPWDFDLARQNPNKPPPAPWTIQPTHPELLDALAEDFRKNNHDLRRLFRLIVNSSAYQLSSKFPGEWKSSYAKYYARKFVRRLSAEEMHDAIVKATELYTEIPIRGEDLRVKFATETRSPEDFVNAGKKDTAFFLLAFGQTNRDYSERSNEGAITQAILLMNSPFVTDKVAAKPGSFLAKLLERKPALSDEQTIEELYLRFLLRPPSADEMAMAKEIAQKNRKQGLEDLQWVLMNKVEFIFNY